MPSRKTVYDYLEGAEKEHIAFQKQYQSTEKFRAHLIADECLDIIDEEPRRLQKTNENGESYLIPDRDQLRRAKLRTSARHWLLERMWPETYGPPRAAQKPKSAKHPEPVIVPTPGTIDPRRFVFRMTDTGKFSDRLGYAGSFPAGHAEG